MESRPETMKDAVRRAAEGIKKEGRAAWDVVVDKAKKPPVGATAAGVAVLAAAAIWGATEAAVAALAAFAVFRMLRRRIRVEHVEEHVEQH